MKKQEIRKLYSQKAAELLAAGYNIFPDTMRGHQGEIAHVDFSNGSEILRLLLSTDHRYSRDEGEYIGDTVVLMLGKAPDDTRVYENWDGDIWNKRLEIRFQIEWAWIGANRYHDWYTSLEEGNRISRLQWERYKAHQVESRETLSDAFKSAALKWIRKQPRMKSCKLEDIEKIERCWDHNGNRRFEITAKGKRYTIR